MADRRYCLEHDLAIVTRNSKDFAETGLGDHQPLDCFLTA